MEERRRRERLSRGRSRFGAYFYYSRAPSRLPRTARGDGGDRGRRAHSSLGFGEKSLRRAQPAFEVLVYPRGAHPHEPGQRRRRVRRQGRRRRSAGAVFSGAKSEEGGEDRDEL